MSNQDFDPYYHWLGIPPHEQPPNHYRLLGISLFETDPRVIGNAADQRMLLLRSFQAGPNALKAQPLMSQIETARATLLTPADRAAYDQLLHAYTQQALAHHQATIQHYYQPPPPAPVPPPHLVHQAAYVPVEHAYLPTEPPQLFIPTMAESPVERPPERVADFYQQPQSSYVSRRNSTSRPKGNEVSVIVQSIVGGLAGLAIAYVFITYALPKLRQQTASATNVPTTNTPSRATPTPAPNSGRLTPTAPLNPSLPNIIPTPTKPLVPIPPQKVPSNLFVTPSTNTLEEMDEPRNRETDSNPQPSVSVASELPKYLKLPSLTEVDEVLLFPLPKTLPDSIDFRLTPIFGKSPVTLTRPEQGIWSLTAKPLSETDALEIGQISVKDDGVYFSWKNLDKLPNIRGSLINFLLSIDINGKTSTAQFRKVITQPALSLDLHKDRTESEFRIVLPPPKETIVVRISNVQSPLPTTFKDDKQEVPLGQDIAICWSQTPGPEMRIRCVAGENELKIITQNRFIEGNDASTTGITWTFDNLSKTIASIEAKRDKARSEYEAIVNNQIPAAISTMKDVESTTARTGPEVLQRAQLLTKLQADLKRLRMRGSSLEKQVPELEARLAAAPSLNTFMQSVDGSTSVELEVVAQNGNHEIILLRLTSASLDSPAFSQP